jgi:hypothetical protein
MRRSGHVSQQSSSPVMSQKLELRIPPPSHSTGPHSEGKGEIPVSHLPFLRCLRRKDQGFGISLFTTSKRHWFRGSVVVKALFYKPEGRGFDSR